MIYDTFEANGVQECVSLFWEPGYVCQSKLLFNKCLYCCNNVRHYSTSGLHSPGSIKGTHEDVISASISLQSGALSWLYGSMDTYDSLLFPA